MHRVPHHFPVCRWPAHSGLPLRGLLLLLAATTSAGVSAEDDISALSLEQLLEVKVTGAAKYEQPVSQAAAAVSVITRSEIKAFGWRTLGDALASLPGVYTTYDRQYSYLGTRGMGAPGDLTARVLVAVNGNRLNDPVYDGGTVGRELPLDIDLIERIEFIPGPGGAVYGQNAMFGVVNVITRSGMEMNGAELSAAYQDPQDAVEGRAAWGKRLTNGLDILVSASGLKASGEDLFFDYGASGVSGKAAGLDGESDQQYFTRLARGAWSADFMFGKRHKDDPTASFFADPLASGNFGGDEYTVGQLQYSDRYAADTLEVTARLFGGRYRYTGTLLFGTPVSYPAFGDWLGSEWRAVSSAITHHRLMLGVEGQENLRADQAARDRARPLNNFTIAGSSYRVGVYAQDEWQLSPQFAATLGLRVDHNSRSGTALSPRAALIWQPQQRTALKVLAGRAHRAPNAYERDYDDPTSQLPNPGLKDEHIDTLELVVDHHLDPGLSLRASLYQWLMFDIISLSTDPASGFAQYVSGHTIKANGLELSADKQWAYGTRLRGSVSLQDAHYTDGPDVLNSPKLMFKLNLSTPLPWAGLRAGYELQTDSSRLSLDGSRLGGYAISNLHLSSDALAHGLEVSFTVRNLANRHFAHPGSESNWQNALQQDGRSFRVQAEFRF